MHRRVKWPTAARRVKLQTRDHVPPVARIYGIHQHLVQQGPNHHQTTTKPDNLRLLNTQLTIILGGSSRLASPLLTMRR